MFRWFYNLIYGSELASFESAYSLDESVKRLSDASTDSIIATLGRQTAYGSVSDHEVQLTRTIPFVRNSFKPVFVGSFQRVGDRTILVGKFTMHWVAKAFLSLWFGFCALWTLLVLVAGISKGLGEVWWMPLGGTGFFLFGILLVGFCRWLSRNDVAWISTVISNALSGKTA